MAVAAPEGASTIVFKYETPGLVIGIYITLAAALISVIYLIIIMIKRHFKPATEAEYPEGERIAQHIALYEAANYEAEHNENEHLLDDIDHTKIDAYQGFIGGFKFDESVLEGLDDEPNETEEKEDE